PAACVLRGAGIKRNLWPRRCWPGEDAAPGGGAPMTKPPEWRPPADQLPGQYSDYHIHHKRRGDPARKGGFGVVYRASRADVPGMSYALKCLTREGLPYEAILEEARTAIGLSHEYVAKTIDVLDLRPYQGDGWCPAALVMLFYPASLKDVIELLRNDKE